MWRSTIGSSSEDASSSTTLWEVLDFFFPQIICQFQLFSLILQLHLPVAAVMSYE
jgi:hypothetical protein